jgi:hypothetical protein
MRAYLFFFVATFGADPADPTFDPEENDVVLLDEYAADDGLPDVRLLQFFGNNTTSTEETDTSPSIPLVPLALVGVGGAIAAAYFLMQPSYTYETHDYDHAAESGLLEHPEYDVHDMDDSDYE